MPVFFITKSRIKMSDLLKITIDFEGKIAYTK